MPEALLSKSVKVLDLTNAGDVGALYENEDHTVSHVMSRQDYDDFAQPNQITVTIQAGDLLNPATESKMEQFLEDDEVEAPASFTAQEYEALESMETEANDLDAGFDMEQCSIRQSHPEHVWSRMTDPGKTLMCEGRS